ncbi:MAG: histidinol-phosphatase [Bdellovibrionales bacterium]
MKKIDLHIHTLSTSRDAQFEFSLDCLKNYVSRAALNAIAITNHNIFDIGQFKDIQKAIDIVVFPGIEINLGTGHLLVIGDPSCTENFSVQAEKVAGKISGAGNSISVKELEEIYEDLEQYLLIPHYDKRPALNGDDLSCLSKYISAGEVDSPKKFIRLCKDQSKPTPVIFSDARMSPNLQCLPTKQTFVDCGELTLGALKACLKDKSKVALSENEGNNLFQIFEDGQKLSTGLNVLLGERSSGKTHTLNRISESFGSSDNVKYIEQFSLVQHEAINSEKEFDKGLQRKQSRFAEEYLSGFKIVLDDVIDIDLAINERAIEGYVTDLLKSAEEADKKDSFSQAALFDETLFPLGDDEGLGELIASVRHVIENIGYREIIERHLDRAPLKRLAVELIELLWKKSDDKKIKNFVNEVVRDIKRGLKLETSATQLEDIDLYKICMETKKVERFTQIVSCLYKEQDFPVENIQGFQIVAKKGSFNGALELRSANGNKGTFKDCFSKYGKPYEYLRCLKENENVVPAEAYRLFAKIGFVVLNKNGFEISGGERSEFRLLEEIQDAQNYEILLIDEPESSFDNMFLNSEVNQIIKKISRSTPVVVVTHNSTIGASVGADYLLYAKKDASKDGVVYKLYSGHPTDRILRSACGDQIKNHDVMLNSLEAGYDIYRDRGAKYEAVKE